MDHHPHPHLPHYEIRIISRETIKPSSPTPRHLATFKLSLVDHHMAETLYMPCIFFYPPTGTGSSSSLPTFRDETSSILKSSLAHTLTRFYPLAGRLSKSTPIIHCNDEGVPFSVAALHGDVTMISLLTRGPPDADALQHFLPFPAAHLRQNEQEQSPQFAARATFSPCGGVAIGICCLHKIIDAHTMIYFMNLWTAFARGSVDVGGAYAHNRAATSLFPVNDVGPPAVDFGGEEEEKKRVTRRFVFDREAIWALKERARSDRVSHPSRSEVVGVFIWKSAVNAAARSISSVGGVGKEVAVHSVAGMAVDLRPRMKYSGAWPDYSIGNIFWFPPLVYGNKVVQLVESQSRCQLKETKTLEELVTESRASIERVDGEFMKKIEKGGGRGEFERNQEAWCKALMMMGGESSSDHNKVMVFSMSSMIGIGVYDVDFGWGKPVWVGMATYANRAHNVVVLMESPVGYGVEAWLTLSAQDMSMLESDPQFLVYANTNPSVVGPASLARL